jgi:hypothetical protein
MIHVGFSDNDPLRLATRGMFLQRYPSDVYLMALPECEPKLAHASKLPPYIDLARI